MDCTLLDQSIISEPIIKKDLPTEPAFLEWIIEEEKQQDQISNTEHKEAKYTEAEHISPEHPLVSAQEIAPFELDLQSSELDGIQSTPVLIETSQADQGNDLNQSAVKVSTVTTLDQIQDGIAQEATQEILTANLAHSAGFVEPDVELSRTVDLLLKPVPLVSEKVDLCKVDQKIPIEQLDSIEQKNSIVALVKHIDTDEKCCNFSSNEIVDLHDQSSKTKEQTCVDLGSKDVEKTTSMLSSSQPVILSETVEQELSIIDEKLETKIEIQDARETTSFKENSMYLNLKTQILYSKWKPVKEKKERKLYINPLYVISIIILVLGGNVAYLAYGKYQKYQQEQEEKLYLYKLEQEKKNAAQKNAALRK